MSDRGLDEYKKKRDFRKTPEPEGQVVDPFGDQPRFVVQEHDATRLHFDLRLEIDGVLKSWAVPKGPSLNPSDKRLAVATEDHPLEYLDFEGVIPEGQYGAGNMIIWDCGTYECIGKEEDPAAAWKKGTLDLRLHGRKLQGMWLLVRLSGEENNWLLFKKQDAYADPSRDITTEMPESVLSGQRVGELVEGSIPPWKSRLQRLLAELQLQPSEIRETVRPMLATLVSQVPAGPHWVYELKYDGVRALARKENREIRLYSRNLKALDRQFPDVMAELQRIPADNFLLDGEIVAMDEEGRSSFQMLQSRLNLASTSAIREALEKVPAYYMVFDLLGCEGYDLRQATLLERQKILRALLVESQVVRQVDTLRADGANFLRLACEKGLEGIVAKDSTSSYRSSRSPAWQKIKCTLSELFVIGGFTAPAGGRKHFGALLVGRYQEDQLVYAGRVGTGFDEATLTDLSARLEGLKTGKAPFLAVPAEVRGATWVKPELICEVKFSEWTRDGLLRAPVFLDLRTDLSQEDRRAESPRMSVNPADTRSDLDDYDFLSNLDKLFWPDLGYTKRDLVEYYHRIAPVLLPYLKDRPMNLERYPDGINGKSFYQKDTPDFFPDWVDTVPISSDSSGKENRYVVCNSREALVYLANLACIPLHPWSSRIKTIKYPDFAIIDLDPDPSLPFAKVCRFALKIRGLLDRMDLKSYPKTSGSKGLHILIPVRPRHTYETIRSFAEILARLSVYGSEDVATIERSMERRKGKIYVDYLQNGMGKTIVSPYCLRPREGAPVSTPLDWSEVGAAGVSPDAFNMKNIFRRLEHRGDPLQGLLTEKQSLQAVLKNLENVISGEGNTGK